jgi:ABC-type multidrug transport system permease subunit
MPSWFKEFSVQFSPFTLFLESSRAVYAKTIPNDLFLIVLLKLALWGILFFVGRFSISKGIEFYRNSGKPVVISHY